MTTFTVDGVDYELIEDLNVGQVIEVEALTGAPFGEASAAQTMFATLFLSMKVVQKDLRWNDFSKIPLSQIVLPEVAVDDGAPKEEPVDSETAT